MSASHQKFLSPERRTEPPRLAALAEELVGAVPALAETEQGVAVALYRLLAEGKPVGPATIAERVGLSDEQVAATLGSWPGVYFDEEGRVIGFWGLVLGEMPHRFEVEGRTLYAWCAWDALFIPVILGKEAHVASPCATTGDPISLTVGSGGVRDISPEGAVLSFLRPEGRFDHDVILSFCHYVLFFRSEATGREWTANHPNTFLLSLEDGFQLGRLTWEAKLGAALRERPAEAA